MAIDEAREFAPAKVNLTLHVTGRRADGYHLLDSLVVFAGIGDEVTARKGDGLTLAIDGPQAAALAGGDNLVLRAARLLGATDVALELRKRLPVASGIGGGSSDAAAAIRAICALDERPLPEAAAVAALGSDVPVCLEPRPRRMSAAGEILSDPLDLPPAWLVLANPGVAVPTAAVFAALTGRSNPPMPAPLPALPDAAALARFVSAMRNDLEEPAIRIAPQIAAVRAALAAQPGCLAARMSGSGATCFGLFASPDAAGQAAVAIAMAQPGWWVESAPMLR